MADHLSELSVQIFCTKLESGQRYLPTQFYDKFINAKEVEKLRIENFNG